jgi:hypothetical protein
MAETDSKGETKWHKIGGVQVYARRDDEGKPTKADAIDEDEAEIRKIADRLQKSGFGVLRERVPRAGRVYHRLNALWASDGDPPENPFANP